MQAVAGGLGISWYCHSTQLRERRGLNTLAPLSIPKAKTNISRDEHSVGVHSFRVVTVTRSRLRRVASAPQSKSLVERVALDDVIEREACNGGRAAEASVSGRRSVDSTSSVASVNECNSVDLSILAAAPAPPPDDNIDDMSDWTPSSTMSWPPAVRRWKYNMCLTHVEPA